MPEKSIITATNLNSRSPMVAPTTLKSEVPLGYRLAEKPDGSLVLQGLYGTAEPHGEHHPYMVERYDWENLPTVKIGENGKELP